MHIYFIGVPTTRIQALAEQAVANDNTVTIATTNGSEIHQSVQFPGIAIEFSPSLDPRMPGGYIYILLACLRAVFSRPDTIVVHGWQTALIARFLHPLLKDTCFIYIADSLPISKRVASYIASAFDRICSTTRTLQYHLLADYMIKTSYIPNGYAEQYLADIRPAFAGLAKEKYAVVLSQDSKEIRKISRAFISTKSRKKLVAFGKGRSSARITYIDTPLTSRLASSIVRQAAVIVSADSSYSPLILQAMDAGRQIIATTDPLHEELIGVTGQYYPQQDYALLSGLLRNTLRKPLPNPSASMRAKRHFTWNVIGQEYERVYRLSKTVLVPFDSIIPKQSFKIAV